MRHVPGHVKGSRPAARDAAGDAARRSGVSVGAAFAMIRKEIQDLRRQTSRPAVEPAAFEHQLHELAAQINALQETAGPGGAGPGQDAFLQQLKGLLSQNLTAFQQQVAVTAATAISGPAESIRRDVASLKEIQASVDRRTQDTFEAVYGTIERIVDRLAAIEDELRERNSEPEADDAPPPARETPPADDTDRSGMSAAPPAAPPASIPADGAGPTVLLRQPAVLPEGTLDAAVGEDAAKADPTEPVVRTVLKPIELVRMRFRTGTGPQLTPRVNPPRKEWVIGLAAAVVALFALTLTLDFYHVPADPAVMVAATVPDAGRTDGLSGAAAPSPDQPPAHEDSKEDNKQDTRQNTTPESDRDTSRDLNPPPDPAPDTAAPVAGKDDPTTTAAADPTPWDGDALMRNLLLPPPPVRDPWPQTGPPPGTEVRTAPLPPTIGSKTLVAAAQAGDPGACYEIGIRFALGHNTTPDAAKAAAWLDRAAQAGLAAAQFRLASMYEKGLGVRKNLVEARRLYMAAAAQGHAKAMHNLAVLYTRGINGPPDYRMAVEWFRKAAVYGTVDSQYNLGILYARGAGAERDLVESWKWFALAAKGGDKDAAHKRDEVAKGLDAKQLEAAKARADAFVAMLQPDEATATRAPAGGWDRTATAAAATTKTRPFAHAERSPGK